MSAIMPLTHALVDARFPKVIADIVWGYTVSNSRLWQLIAQCGEYETCFEDKVYKPVVFYGACTGGHIEIVSVLISHKDVDLGALMYGMITASQNGHIDMIQYLEKHYLLKGGQNYIKKLMKAAALAGQALVVEMLIDRYPDHRHSAIFAAREACDGNHPSVIEMLWSHGIKYDHCNIFVRACRYGSLKVAELLLRLYPDVNVNEGLIAACDRNPSYRQNSGPDNIPVVEFLISSGAREVNAAYFTALTSGSCPNLCNLLIKHGALPPSLKSDRCDV